MERLSETIVSTQCHNGADHRGPANQPAADFYHPEAWNNYKNQTTSSRTAAKARVGATPKQAYSIILKNGEDSRPGDGAHRQKICNRHGDHPAKYGKENGSEIAAHESSD